MFNLRSERAKQRELAVQQRLLAGHERKVFAPVRREFDRVGKAAAAAYKSGGKKGAEGVIKAHKTKLTTILTPQWIATAETFSERVISTGSKALSLIERKNEVDDAFTRDLLAWLESNGGTKIVAISDTTKDAIIAAIKANDAAGEATVARAIVDATGGAIGRARAAVIARTEAHSAANFAENASIDAMGIADDVVKQWMATESDRTRDSHRAAHNQTQKMPDNFDVGGASLAYPGDPSGPGAEIINCRCGMGYVS